jgi:hypothetical protein
VRGKHSGLLQDVGKRHFNVFPVVVVNYSLSNNNFAFVSKVNKQADVSFTCKSLEEEI